MTDIVVETSTDPEVVIDSPQDVVVEADPSSQVIVETPTDIVVEVSCAEIEVVEVSTPGPQGAQGQTGAQGPAGEDGEPPFTYIQPDEPVGADIGDLWVDTDDEVALIEGLPGPMGPAGPAGRDAAGTSGLEVDPTDPHVLLVPLSSGSGYFVDLDPAILDIVLADA